MTGSTLILAVFLCAGGDDVLARVDRAPITRAFFLARVDAAGPQAARVGPDGILDSIIGEILLASEGHRLGLERSPAVVARIEAGLRRAAGEAFVEKEIAGRIKPDDQMLRAMFHSTADFVSFESLTFAKVESAAAALERIRRGSTFAAEAKGAVVARIYADGAAAPLTMRGQVDRALADRLFEAPPGKVIGPIKLADGAAIARVIAKQVGTDETFAQRRASIAAYARKQLAAEMREHVVAQLRSSSGVTLDEAFLRSLGAGDPTPEQREHVLATVDGRPLRYRDIQDGIRAVGAAAAGHMGPAVRIRYAWQQVDARLVEGVAVKRGFLNASEVVRQRPEIERAAVAQAAMEKILAETPPPTEKEIEAFYRRNAERFGKPFSQVLPLAAAGAAQEKAQSAITQAVARLRKQASISIDREAVARAARGGA